MRRRAATPPLGHPVVGRLGEPRGHTHRLVLRGPFEVDAAGKVWDELRRQTERLERGDELELDMAYVDTIDARTIALLVNVRNDLIRRGVATEFSNAREHVQDLIRLHAGDLEPPPRRRRRPETFLAEVGRRTYELALEVKNVLAFLGAAVRAMFGLLREPRSGNWRQVFPTMERAGADAVPIVLLINFLVGFGIAYQAAGQLKQFGADIYVAHLVGASITREMGPLMTAIILTGRSGAAFAAELGTMKVGEEIDALRTMGFGPFRFLVLPRMVGLVLVMPILTLLADVFGILGGFCGGAMKLEVNGLTFFHALQQHVDLADVVTGLVKSVAFGVAIALIACQQGFAASGGAEGVGRRTTASVVAILFALILLDTGFTVFFEAFDL